MGVSYQLGLPHAMSAGGIQQCAGMQLGLPVTSFCTPRRGLSTHVDSLHIASNQHTATSAVQLNISFLRCLARLARLVEKGLHVGGGWGRLHDNGPNWEKVLRVLLICKVHVEDQVVLIPLLQRGLAQARLQDRTECLAVRSKFGRE